MSGPILARPSVGKIRLRDGQRAVTVSAAGQRVIVRAEHLEPRCAVFGEAVDVEQLVGEADDLVALSHGPIIATLSALGVWRSLVARSVRVGEVPSSNLGTPTFRKAGIRRSGFPPRESRLRRARP